MAEENKNVETLEGQGNEEQKEQSQPEKKYTDEEVNNISVKNSKKAVTISDEAESVAFNNVDGKVYFVADEELYEAKTSDSSKKKVSIDGDVYSVSSSTKGVMAFAEDGGDYTCYAIGKKLVTVYEN